MNRSPMAQSIIDRAIGIVKLDDATYESIEHDQAATTQAAVVVAIAAVAGGIGALDDGFSGLIGGIILGILGWFVISACVYFAGTKLIPSGATEADMGQVLRLIGFAQVVGIANILGFVPVVGAIIAVIAAIWGIVVTVKAIKHALEMSTGRAIATAILAWVVFIVVAVIIAAIFGTGVAIAG